MRSTCLCLWRTCSAAGAGDEHLRTVRVVAAVVLDTVLVERALADIDPFRLTRTAWVAHLVFSAARHRVFWRGGRHGA